MVPDIIIAKNISDHDIILHDFDIIMLKGEEIELSNNSLKYELYDCQQLYDEIASGDIILISNDQIVKDPILKLAKVSMSGLEFYYTKDESENSTTSKKYIEKLKLNIPEVSSGLFRITWRFEIKSSGGNSHKSFACIMIDDMKILSEVEHRSYNINICKYKKNLDFSYIMQSGSHIIALCREPHHISLKWKAGSSCKNVAYIRNSYLEAWRVK